jgi:hypothetical protein
MTAPTSVFQLGRMRHLDLLALWHELNPGNAYSHGECLIAGVSKEHLVAAILATRPPTRTGR